MKRSLFFAFLLSVCIHTVFAQQILLDKPVRAGELIVFPALGQTAASKNYYYLPDKPRIGRHPDNKPMFSFLRYVKNERTSVESNTSITESQTGGGVVHALVELSVSDDQVKEAERALQRIDAGGKIVGPVVFKSGTVALISGIANKDGGYAQTVVGLGSAPILENQKAAVAVMLNAMGSKLLWETFNTPTPDFSIQFDMEVAGFLAPKRVTIEADFEQMYKNSTFEAAIAMPVLQAEIGMAMDEMMNNGTIKVTQVGEDASMDRVRDAVMTQLLNLMFERVGGTGVPQINQLMGMNNRPGILDRASGMLNQARADHRAEQARAGNQPAPATSNAPASTPPAGGNTTAPSNPPATTTTAPATTPPTPADTSRAAAAPATTPANTTPATTPATTTPATTSTSRPATTTPATQPATNPSGNTQQPGANTNTAGNRSSAPSLAIAVSYRMREMKQKGKYYMDMNKYTETVRPMPFAYNPGNLKRECPECFREVNLDDPLMKQRDVNATLGGLNAQDFAQYVNFVNVVLRKVHQSGEETVDEIKMDKTQFNQTGNFVKMQYGYKGDKDRLAWLNYEYKTKWSFFGNYSVETPWQKSDFGSIALEPPFVRKTIFLEADPDFIAEQGVRAVEVALFSKLGDVVDQKNVQLKTNRDELSKTVEILLPRGVEDYEYEITWFLKGKEPQKSARKKAQYGRIDLDRF